MPILTLLLGRPMMSWPAGASSVFFFGGMISAFQAHTGQTQRRKANVSAGSGGLPATNSGSGSGKGQWQRHQVKPHHEFFGSRAPF
jgi:hypothetical protein